MEGNGSAAGQEDEDVDESADALFATLTLVVLGVFIGALIFLSVAGNALVIAAILTDRRLRRCSGNAFLASLSLADLLVASLVMTTAGVNDLMGRWPFGPALCDAWVASDVLCSTASILSLCAVALDRHMHIKDPLRYSRRMTRWTVAAGVGTVWLLSALTSFLPISLGLHRPSAEPTDPDASTPPPPVTSTAEEEVPTCALDLTPTYAVVSSCISFYVPCIVMLGIYIRLYRFAQKHVRSIKAITRTTRFGTLEGGGGGGAAGANTLNADGPQRPGPSPVAGGGSCPVSDHKAAVTVGIIMGVFLGCWVPFFCVNIVAAFCKTCVPGIYFKVLTWLGYSNSAFNPIIYSIFNSEFRDAFRRILSAKMSPLACCFVSRSPPAAAVSGGPAGRGRVFGSGRRRSCRAASSGSAISGEILGRDLANAGGGGPRQVNGGACSGPRSSMSSSSSSSAAPRQTRVNSLEATSGERVSAI
ncbi:dopamine receptor 1-like [Ischnura elegans]|uniref:dopamine receptor 1-like n=1 Tax=Ischnura elegans TaxID=197161 RepID=UPI001ED87BF1|nr:dopamine receptor 1-like [Ischnura elegans]